MDKESDTLSRYRERYLASLPPEARSSSRFVEPVAFGFTSQDATEISRLVLEGIKTATGSPLWSYEADGKEPPRVGDLWIVIDGNSMPVCIARTISVEVIPFDEVGEAYARWGGEGDRSMKSWRQMYWKYIVEECQRIGREPTAKAPLVMERFEVVYAQPRSALQ